MDKTLVNGILREEIAERVAEHIVNVCAFHCDPDRRPITFASGLVSPGIKVLLDRLPASPQDYAAVRCELLKLHQRETAALEPEVVACVMGGGALFGPSLAHRLNLPCVFVGKDGTVNFPAIVSGKRVLLIEDVATTLESAARAVGAVRVVGGMPVAVLAIATYGLKRARERAAAENLLFSALVTVKQLMIEAVNRGEMQIDHWREVGHWLAELS